MGVSEEGPLLNEWTAAPPLPEVRLLTDPTSAAGS